MASIDIWNMTDKEVQKLSNTVKELLLERLEKDNLLKEKELADKYVVILAQKGWFGRAIDKLWGLKPDENNFRIVILSVK